MRPSIILLLLFTGCSHQQQDTMQAIVQTGVGGPEVLELQTVPVIWPGPDEVLIRVVAAAVNPVDWKQRTDAGRNAGVQIPGFDAAGIVAAVGDGVDRFAPGDEVFSMIGRIQVDGLNGTYAEYVVAPVDNVVQKPATLSFDQAAGLATTGMTAARTLRRAPVSAGDRVFINGIAGGVGSMVAQIAKARGAYVIGTASARHNRYLASIGVDEVIDYTTTDFTDVVRDIDVAIDTVGPETAARSLSVMRPDGALVFIAGGPSAEQCTAAGVQCPPLYVPEDGEGDMLREVAALAATGELTVNIDARFALADAAKAQELNRAGHTQGKIVLVIADE